MSTKPNPALLPYPFRDTKGSQSLRIPIVFSHAPTLVTAKAAGVIAAWFGKEADFYRETSFPVLIGKLPSHGNAVVFMQDQNLASNAPINASISSNTPTNEYGLNIRKFGIMIKVNPNDPLGLLLIIRGRNQDEILNAAQALALGQLVLSGSEASISQVKLPPLRNPYDAPRWLPDNRPVQFSELAHNEDLMTRGTRPEAMKVNFRFPPDLFNWAGETADFKLKYRYTPTDLIDNARMNVNFNRDLVKSYPLQHVPTDDGVDQAVTRITHLIGDKIVETDRRDVVANWFGFYNQFEFEIFDVVGKKTKCRGMPPTYFQANIDGDSTIDISDIPHYASMPNLGLFVNGGYPFTRLADLSKTAVVMPDALDSNSLSTFLQLMSMMGANTGSPGVNVTLNDAKHVDA